MSHQLLNMLGYSGTESLTGANVCETCSNCFRKMLKSEHLLAKLGLDKAKNEPSNTS